MYICVVRVTAKRVAVAFGELVDYAHSCLESIVEESGAQMVEWGRVSSTNIPSRVMMSVRVDLTAASEHAV